MGCQSSDDQSGVAAELGTDHAVLHLPCRDPKSELYDQRSGVAEHEFAQNHQDARFVPERRSGAATTLAGAAASLEEMELRAELARSAEPVSDSLARAHAGFGKELNQRNRNPKTLKAHQREQGSSYPPEPPVRFVIAKRCSPA